LCVEAYVAVLLGALRVEPLSQVGVSCLKLPVSSVFVGELFAHALQGLPGVLKERPHIVPNEVL
jgi:hypothetical protein